MDNITEIIRLLADITSKLLARSPNYSQKKIEEYYYLLKRYENEKCKEYPDRDDNKLGIYRRDLLLHIAEINTLLSGTSV